MLSTSDRREEVESTRRSGTSKGHQTRRRTVAQTKWNPVRFNWSEDISCCCNCWLASLDRRCRSSRRWEEINHSAGWEPATDRTCVPSIPRRSSLPSSKTPAVRDRYRPVWDVWPSARPNPAASRWTSRTMATSANCSTSCRRTMNVGRIVSITR